MIQERVSLFWSSLLSNEKPHLWSRNGLELEAKFPAIATAVSKLKLRSTILDGEVVAVDENGIPRFQLLQRFQKQPTAPTIV
jgi:ATP-dependent DNA ligase